MSDLQIGLIMIGIVLIVGVLLFNWWQDRRIRRQIAEQFPEHQQDPLMSSGTPDDRLEPALAGAAMPATEAGVSTSSDDDIPDVDAAIEVVIDVGFGAVMSGEQLHQSLTGLGALDIRAMRVIALTDDGAQHARPRSGHNYRSVLLVVLLANRSGPLTAIDWSRLWSFAQTLADDTDGTIEGPDLDTVESRAQALDALCASLDAQVGIVLQLGRALQPDTVADALVQAGLLERQGQWHWFDEHGQSCFMALTDAGAPESAASSGQARLDFVLDLPHTPSSRQAFSRMADVARSLATQLDAELLDDSGQPLPDHADAAIDEQLFQLYEALDEAGFAAGERRTIRVFS